MITQQMVTAYHVLEWAQPAESDSSSAVRMFEMLVILAA